MNRIPFTLFCCICLLPIRAYADDDTDLAKLLDKIIPELGAEDVEARREPQQRWQTLCLQSGAPDKEKERDAICRLMIEKLGPETSIAARVFLLRQLERVGRDECVNKLGDLMGDSEIRIRDSARRALTNIPSQAAGEKLRATLSAAKDDQFRIALINSLGFRAETASIDIVARQLDSKKEAIVAAAANSLRKIGTSKATDALSTARTKTSASARKRIDESYLQCADQLLAKGENAKAAKIYSELASPELDSPLRIAVAKGQLMTAGDRAPVLMLVMLATDQSMLHQVAMNHVQSLDNQSMETLLVGLDKLPTSGRVSLLTALGPRKYRGARPAVLKLADNKNEKVRIAALQALAGVADQSTVRFLVDTMHAGGEFGEVAKQSLQRVFADGVDVEIVALMKKAQNVDQRRQLLELLDARRATTQLDAVIDESSYGDPSIRRQAISILSRLASASEIPGMIGCLKSSPDQGERDEIEKAIVNVCRRIPDPENHADPVLDIYAKSPASDKLKILPLVGRIGGERSLKLVRGELVETQSFAVAVIALSNWPDATVVKDLFAVVNTIEDQYLRVRAVRALARIAVLNDERSDEDRVSTLKQTMDVASRPEDKKLILDRARAVRHIETLRFVVPFLQTESLSGDACKTVVDLAHHRGLREPNQAEFDTALSEVIKKTADKQLADRAQGYMSKKN